MHLNQTPSQPTAYSTAHSTAHPAHQTSSYPLAHERAALLEARLSSHILVLDGAMGTAIQELNLTAKDFGGEALEGCNENLILTRPDVIQAIHEKYLEAGCDIVETNTFGATPVVLDEYHLGEQAFTINRRAAEIARQACDKFDGPIKPRFVAGSIGPTTKAISVTGGITFEELISNFLTQARGLWDGGVDYFLIETCQDTRNIKAALLALDTLFHEKKARLPVAVSGTIEPMGTMLAGQSIDALAVALENRELLYIGLNCATGPEFMTDHIRTLATQSGFRVSCVPNAGLPDENGRYLETPEMVGKVLERFIERGWINVLGGCCGTHSGHIAELAKIAGKHRPRPLPKISRSTLSGMEALEITDELRPVLVGERTNVIGSKKFRTLIAEEKFEEASEITRAQVKGGAQIVDLCLANPDRDEFQDMKRFLEASGKTLKAPLMIDSTDERVIELALTYCQGKAIINSINLEDGEERFEKVIPLAHRFGAALVVGTIDDDPQQGMAVTRTRKLAVAERSYQLLTEKYKVRPEDIYWDPLVFPCASGDVNYVGSAIETIEGIRLIKARFPKTKTILGISNVSFGLPAAGREVLNSVFLYHCVQAGLDLAIVNTEKLERYSSISAEEITLAEDLLFNRLHEKNQNDPVAAFAARFRDKKTTQKPNRKDQPLDARLRSAVIEGSKEGLIDDLNEALGLGRAPLEIINGPLMAGMDEVGRLFNANQLIVAEVLQSAEVMKTAVAHLEPEIKKQKLAQQDTSDSLRGKVILATVKGDVHDIGKNLVEIILSNNGFEVVNLGIKVLPETLIQAVRTHRPQIVGLSGLLVKSAQQMVVTADDLTKAGVDVPILVGGAALSEGFVDRQIAKAYPAGTVAYASDAMHGLELAKRIVAPGGLEGLSRELEDKRQAREEARLKAAQNQPQFQAPSALHSEVRSRTVTLLNELPAPPDFDLHVLRNTPIEQIWNYINPLMLYGRHLGLKGSSVRLLEKAQQGDREAEATLREQDSKALEVHQAVERVKADYANTDFMKPRAIWRFFNAASDGNRLLIQDQHSETRATFEFPRQKREDGLCLSDYVRPRTAHTAPLDTVGFFVVSVGLGVREEAERLKQAGRYLESHIIQILALESAEAYAEFLHSRLRALWGFPDAPEMTHMQRFQAKYRGKRYSFGYPACPRLDDQALLWKLLEPNQIGVELTEGFMMDPEASVSAIVFHHPEATYFSVGNVSGPGGVEENRS
jgi:5-methyltetrahydrofolate--homocysteine methyltransferase